MILKINLYELKKYNYCIYINFFMEKIQKKIIKYLIYYYYNNI